MEVKISQISSHLACSGSMPDEGPSCEVLGLDLGAWSGLGRSSPKTTNSSCSGGGGVGGGVSWSGAM